MKKLFFLILLFAGISNNLAIAQVSDQKVSNVKPIEFSKLLDSTEKRTLVDVRTAKEVATGKIVSSIHIDYYRSDFKEALSVLDKDIPIFVYCRSGVRSGRTANILKSLGFKEIYNLSGGIRSWKGKELPIEE